MLPETFDIEKNNIYNIFINKPFCLSLDESKLLYLGDVLAINMSKLNSKFFNKKIDSKKAIVIFKSIKLTL